MSAPPRSLAGPPVVRVLPDAPAAAREAAALLAGAIAGAAAARGRCDLLLTGGGAARAAYAALAGPAGAGVPWARVHAFWTDERCVPQDHPDSNAGMAAATLLDPVGVPAAQRHRMVGELGPEAGARAYEATLRAALRPGDEGLPAFDAALVGVGPDGHVGSLFPGTPEAAEAARWAVGVHRAGLPPRWPRISLTLPVLGRARLAVVLAPGEAKREAAARALAGDAAVPAARLGALELLVWVLDDAAAGP